MTDVYILDKDWTVKCCSRVYISAVSQTAGAAAPSSHAFVAYKSPKIVFMIFWRTDYTRQASKCLAFISGKGFAVTQDSCSV